MLSVHDQTVKKKAWLCGDDSPAADLSSSAVWVLSLEYKEDFYAQSCNSWYLIFQVSFSLTVWNRQGHDLTCPWSKQNTIDAIKINHIHYKDHIKDTYLKRLVFGNQIDNYLCDINSAPADKHHD